VKLSKFETSWNKIFEDLNILNHFEEHSYFDITAKKIKEVTKREPRLLTKIDFRENLPGIMVDNGLSILAIQNGLYRIAKTDPFIDIPNVQNTERVISIPT